MIESSAAGERKKWRKLIPIIAVVMAAVVFVLVFDVGQLKNFLEKYEKPGLIICLGVYVLLGVTVIPSEPVTLIVLAWKGPYIATLLATVGNSMAAMVEYAIGRNIGDLTDFQAKKDKLPFHLGRLPINSPVFLLLARMLPGFGPKFVSIAGGAFQVPFFTYLWTTVLSNVLGAALVVLGGAGLFNLLD